MRAKHNRTFRSWKGLQPPSVNHCRYDAEREIRDSIETGVKLFLIIDVIGFVIIQTIAFIAGI